MPKFCRANRIEWWKYLHEISPEIKSRFYRPQTKLRKGNVFTPVCQSFCSRVCLSPGQTPPLQTHPLARHPLSACWDTPPVQCMLGYTHPLPSAVVDLRGARGMRTPLWGSKFFQFHAVLGEIWQNHMLVPPRRVGAPSSGKSWIRHCSACWDRHGYCCRRYAPYLNAFLLCLIFFQIAHRRLNVYFTMGAYHTPGRLVEGGVDLSCLKLKGATFKFLKKTFGSDTVKC